MPLPQSRSVTITEAARRLSIARSTIYTVLKIEGAPKAQDGRFDLVEMSDFIGKNAPVVGSDVQERERLSILGRCRLLMALATIQTEVEELIEDESLRARVHKAYLRALNHV